MKTKGELTREKILDAAVKLVIRDGFTDLSFQKIADEVELSQSAVIKHYSSKSKLFSAIRDTASESNIKWVNKYVDKHTAPYDQLVEYAYQTSLWALKHPSYSQIYLLGFYFSHKDKTMKKKNLDAWKVADAKLVHFLEECEKSGYHISGDKDSIAKQLHYWVTGMAMRVFVEKRSISKTAVFKSEIENFLSMWIRPGA